MSGGHSEGRVHREEGTSRGGHSERRVHREDGTARGGCIEMRAQRGEGAAREREEGVRRFNSVDIKYVSATARNVVYAAMQKECSKAYMVISAAMQRSIVAASRFPSSSEQQSRLPSWRIRFRLRMSRTTYLHQAVFLGRHCSQSAILKQPDAPGQLQHVFFARESTSSLVMPV